MTALDWPGLAEDETLTGPTFNGRSLWRFDRHRHGFHKTIPFMTETEHMDADWRRRQVLKLQEVADRKRHFMGAQPA